MRVWKYCRQAHCDDGLPMITAQNEMLDAYIAKHGYILAGETIYNRQFYSGTHQGVFVLWRQTTGNGL